MRKLAIGAALSLLAACSGGSSSPSGSGGCTLTFAGGASETIACDAVVRPNGSGGYVVTVTATRGAGMDIDQFEAVRLIVTPRPVIDVDYGWTSPTVPSGISNQSFAERQVAGAVTHEAIAFDPSGALHVRFSEIPPTDGADPMGWDGIGVVHGTVTGTLVAVSGGGTNVTLTGSF